MFDLFSRKARGLDPASFVRSRERLVRADLASPDDELWRVHDSSDEVRTGASSGEVSLLDLKHELATRLLKPCRLCALECRVDRRSGPAGACGLGPTLSRYLELVHLGEEPEVSPTHAILVSGCNYRCGSCTEWPEVAAPSLAPTSPEELARSIEKRRSEGVASLSWIGGEPGVNLPAILDVLTRVRCSVPVVWNSNMHSTPEVRRLLSGVVDAYVADLKHGNDRCALEVARVPGYLGVVVPAIREAARDAFTIVRHLVLPGHVECCTLPALELLATIPGVRVNVMGQFRPQPAPRSSTRRISSEEFRRAVDAARALGLDLEPRGKLEGEKPLAASPSSDFSSSIFVDDDGKVTVENLSPDLADLLEELQ